MPSRRAHVVTIALIALVPPASAQPVNTQLVTNAGAETGDTTGWVSDGIDAIPAFGAAAGFGAWTFTAGKGPEADQQLTQDIPITTLAPSIDAGLARAKFSLYIQSRSIAGTNDVGSARLLFLSESGASLDANTFTDPPLPTETWDLYAVDRPVPAQTRTIRVILDADRNGGLSTDCFFDEVSLRLLGCNDSDLAPPLGVLDFSDVLAFLTAFGAGDPSADLAAPVGVFDFSDVLAFLTAFGAGCQ